MSEVENTKVSNERVLVLGGTGKTGRRIVKQLANAGVPTRIGSRNVDRPFDWQDQRNWAAVLENVSAVYLSYAPDLAIPGATESVRDFVEIAVQSGVKRLVLLSGRGEEEAQRCERIVQDAGVEWTVVRASWFSQNFSEGEFLDMVLTGAITLPAGDVQEPFVDVDDIVDVAVAALTESGHDGQVYEVTGPQLLTFKQAVAEIACASGRDIDYIQIPHEVFTAGIVESGAPEDIVWLLDYLFATVLDGRNAFVSDGVQRALGREPTDFADFARKIALSGVWGIPTNHQAAVGQ